jgi:hypothetical protein
MDASQPLPFTQTRLRSYAAKLDAAIGGELLVHAAVHKQQRTNPVAHVAAPLAWHGHHQQAAFTWA